MEISSSQKEAEQIRRSFHLEHDNSGVTGTELCISAAEFSFNRTSVHSQWSACCAKLFSEKVQTNTRNFSRTDNQNWNVLKQFACDYLTVSNDSNDSAQMMISGELSYARSLPAITPF